MKCLEAFIPAEKGAISQEMEAGEKTKWDRHLKWNKLLRPQRQNCQIDASESISQFRVELVITIKVQDQREG